MSAIVRDIPRNCNMSYFSKTLCVELLICHQITVSLEAVNKMSQNVKNVKMSKCQNVTKCQLQISCTNIISQDSCY